MLCERLTDPARLGDRRYVAEPKLDGQRAQFTSRAAAPSRATAGPVWIFCGTPEWCGSARSCGPSTPRCWTARRARVTATRGSRPCSPSGSAPAETCPSRQCPTIDTPAGAEMQTDGLGQLSLGGGASDKGLYVIYAPTRMAGEPIGVASAQLGASSSTPARTSHSVGLTPMTSSPTIIRAAPPPLIRDEHSTAHRGHARSHPNG